MLPSRIKITLSGRREEVVTVESVDTQPDTRPPRRARRPDRTYVVPRAVIVFLLALDFDSLVCHVEGVQELPVGQEESHEVVFLDVGYIKDEAKG